jgi:acid-sensing ion channel, other
VLANTYVKWQYKPDVVTSRKKANVGNIPFPSITVCPQTKTKTSFVVFENVFRELFEGSRIHGAALEESKYFETMLHICNPQLLDMITINQSVLHVDKELTEILRSFSYAVNDSMMFCKWRNVIEECENLFTEILTDQGICYSFNILDYSDIVKENVMHNDFRFNTRPKSSWTLKNGYKSNDLTAYPWPVISQQYDALRVLLMTTDTDTDYVCQGSLQGFKIYFHQPNEFPKTFSQHVFVPIEQEAVITVKAVKTTSALNLLDYEPHLRGCYQTDEKKLKFYQDYTKNNCEVECLTEFVLRTCGCVKFSMPRENVTKLCGLKQIECTARAERHWISMMNDDIKEDFKCECLDSCTEIEYQPQLSLSSFDYEALFDSYSYDLSEYPGFVFFFLQTILILFNIFLELSCPD